MFGLCRLNNLKLAINNDSPNTLVTSVIRRLINGSALQFLGDLGDNLFVLRHLSKWN